MWKTLKLTKYAEWVELASGETLDACKASANLEEGDGVYYLWDGEIPEDKEASVRLFEEVNKANGGRVSMVARIDMSGAKPGPGLLSCSGNCFCVIAHGMRRCETYWCSISGWCWWVSCGMSC